MGKIVKKVERSEEQVVVGRERGVSFFFFGFGLVLGLGLGFGMGFWERVERGWGREGGRWLFLLISLPLPTDAKVSIYLGSMGRSK